jgi:hypothetical protein
MFLKVRRHIKPFRLDFKGGERMKYFVITLLLILVPVIGGCILAILDTMWDIAEGLDKGWYDVD